MKNIIKSFSYGFAGFVLATVGLFLLWSHQGPSLVKGASGGGTNTPYTTHWQAAKLYRVQAQTNGNNQDLNAIGVAQWHVTGTMGGSSFSEDWTGPSADSISANGGNCSGGNYDHSKWLFGCLSVDLSYRSTTFKLTLADPTAQTSGGSNGEMGIGSGLGIVSGNGQLAPYYVTTGTYAFNVPSGAPNPFHISVLMMPLQWDVSGTLTQ